VTARTSSPFRRGRSTLVEMSGVLLLGSLAACGGSSSGETSSSTAGDGATSTTAAAAAASTGDAAHAGSIDLCSLLTPADASAVATQFKLSSDSAAKYKLVTEKQPPPTTSYPTSACKFTIAEVTADNTGSEAIVWVTAFPAQYLDKTGTKIDGLGDEAYDEGGFVEVRAGDIGLQSNEHQGASTDFINALYRDMIAHLT
jgi:hypothetical protein